MKINIYQINHERDDKRLMFFGLDEVQKLTGSKMVKAEIYDKIFSGDVDCHSLEDVYRKFNEEHPAGYKGRSLSVSDVVEIVESDNTEKGFYYCDNYGFKTISFEPEKAQDTVSKNQITVLYLQVGKLPQTVSIDNSLEAMQRLVGGYIEEYMPFDDEVALICNEEGKMNGSSLNRAVYDEHSKEMIEIIAGDFFIAYAPVGSENFKSLPKDLEKKYAEKFKYPERFYKQNGQIKAYPVKPKDRDMER